MELAPFDPIDFKKFTDGKTIVKVSKYPANIFQIPNQSLHKLIIPSDVPDRRILTWTHSLRMKPSYTSLTVSKRHREPQASTSK